MDVILIVNDMPEALKLYQYVLANGGKYQAVTASSADEADVRLQAGLSPDLIITDDMMPGTHGHDWCRQLRSRPQTKDIPILGMTLRMEPYQTNAFLEAGADALVHPPVHPAELRAKVRALLRKIRGPVVHIYRTEHEWDVRYMALRYQLDITVEKTMSLRNWHEVPHLAIIDNDLEACHEFRSHRPYTPILYLSLHTGTESTLAALRAGATDVLHTAPTDADLLRAIRRLLGPHLRDGSMKGISWR